MNNYYMLATPPKKLIGVKKKEETLMLGSSNPVSPQMRRGRWYTVEKRKRGNLCKFELIRRNLLCNLP